MLDMRKKGKVKHEADFGKRGVEGKYTSFYLFIWVDLI